MSLFFLLCKHANIQIEEKNNISTPNLFWGILLCQQAVLLTANCLASNYM